MISPPGVSVHSLRGLPTHSRCDGRVQLLLRLLINCRLLTTWMAHTATYCMTACLNMSYNAFFFIPQNLPNNNFFLKKKGGGSVKWCGSGQQVNALQILL